LCVLLPLIIGNFLPAFKGEISEIVDSEKKEPNKYGPFMLTLGLIMIVFVPVFKTITHLPPYMGMMLSLAVVAIAAEVLSNRSFSISNANGHHGGGHGQAPTLKALSKIEMPSVLFFLGILMTVAALESLGLIFSFGKDVNALIPEDLFVTLLGVASAVIDNVPLVAASMGMFQEVMDAKVWHFIAYAAGTGGSMLIIGSAAGVVAMGMEKISFGWYLKNISWLALLGYAAGIIWIVLM
jgi:Na+/H+ antiporter NhaD/arsenite permease-like protein